MPDTQSCIFCKIIAGELPSSRIYEDEDILAFLDIHPTHKGHTLVIPKKHSDTFLNTDEETVKKVMHVLPSIAKAVVQGVSADGCNISINNGSAAGQDVFHMHWHIIPRYENDGFSLWPKGSYAEGEKETVAEKIRDLVTAHDVLPEDK